MIAKLVTFSPNGREASIAKALKALSQYKILGLETNVEFLKRCYENSDFQKGDFDSNFIKTRLDKLLVERPLIDEEAASGVAAFCFLEAIELNPEMLEETGPWDRGDTYRMSYEETKELKFDIEVGDEVTHYTVKIANRGEPNCFDIELQKEGEEQSRQFERVWIKEEADRVAVEINGRVERYFTLKEG